MAARELAAIGYSNVRVFRGGKAEWVKAKLPIEGELPEKIARED